MDTNEKKRGGARPGSGKKPQVAGAPATSPVTIKMSAEQKEKLQLLGGAQWVRDSIDQVKLTANKRKLLERFRKLEKDPPKE